MEETKLLNNRLVVTTGDITAITTQAVVNAANSSLLGGGGVDGAIHRMGGSSILDECREIRKKSYPRGLPPGEAVVTRAGNLPAEYVIHTVGPVWHGGTRNEEETLKNCYTNSLKIALKLSVKDIAFPAISTGVYGFPKDRAAVIVFHVMCDFLKRNKIPQTVYLVFYSAADAESFIRSIGE